MFRYHVHSTEFEDAVKKIAIAIPAANKKGAGDCVQLSLYKTVGNSSKSIGIFLGFNGKIEAISTMEINDVEADEEQLNIYVSGSKLLAAASAFGAIDTVLEITLDKEMCISGAGSKVSLPLGEETSKINPNEAMFIETELEADKFVRFLDFGASCYQDGKGAHGMNCVGIRFSHQEKKLSVASSNGSRAVYAEVSDVVIKKKEGEEKESSDITVTVEGNLLKSAIRNLAGKSKLTISTNGKRLVLKKGTYVIIILTSEQAFPFEAVLQITNRNDTKGTWKAPMDKILQALSIYEITMETPWLEITKKNDSQMSFQGKDELTTASVTCAQQNEVGRIVIDEKQFKDSINIFSVRYGKNADIYIGVSDEEKPLSIRKNLNDSDCIIILPIVSK